MTDVILSKISGRDLAERIKLYCPGVKVLFMSGNIMYKIAYHVVPDPGINFIQNHFAIKDIVGDAKR